MMRTLGACALTILFAGGCASAAPTDLKVRSESSAEASASVAPTVLASATSSSPAVAATPQAPPSASVAATGSAASGTPPAPPLRPLPKAPDLELLREIQSGLRSVSELIDSTKGVDVVYGGTRPCEPPSCPANDRKLCTAEGIEEVRALIAEAADNIEVLRDDGPVTTCNGMTCNKRPTGEWSPDEEFVFAPTKDGLRLVSITQLDVLLRDESAVNADAKRFPARLRALALGRCSAGGAAKKP